MEQGLRVSQAGDFTAALAEARANPPDLAIVAAALPPAGGLELLKQLKRDDPRLPVIVTAASGATGETIEATKLGAFDYVARPFVPQDFVSLVRQALEAGRFMRSPVQMNQSQEITAGDALLGRSRPMQELYKAIGRAAATDATVLIQGESGTGKELVARALFQHSTRAEKPFVVVNCVAIPETLLESELFGYEKGAFTGAAARRIGKIEQADGGTVFLDEIGDMPLAIQAKMLRLLAERSVERIGGRHPIPVDVRIIAATNRDLTQAVKDERFREDLYYRLNVVAINLPPPPGAARGRAPVGRLLPGPGHPRAGGAQPGHHRRGLRDARRPRLAGQRARAGQRHGEVPHLRPGPAGGGRGGGHPGAGRRRRLGGLPEPRDGPGHPGLGAARASPPAATACWGPYSAGWRRSSSARPCRPPGATAAGRPACWGCRAPPCWPRLKKYSIG